MGEKHRTLDLICIAAGREAPLVEGVAVGSTGKPAVGIPIKKKKKERDSVKG